MKRILCAVPDFTERRVGSMVDREKFVSVRIDSPISDLQQEAILRVISNQNTAAIQANKIRLESLRQLGRAIMKENTARDHLGQYIDRAIEELGNINESRVVSHEAEMVYLDVDPSAIGREAVEASAGAVVDEILDRCVDDEAVGAN